MHDLNAATFSCAKLKLHTNTLAVNDAPAAPTYSAGTSLCACPPCWLSLAEKAQKLEDAGNNS